MPTSASIGMAVVCLIAAALVVSVVSADKTLLIPEAPKAEHSKIWACTDTGRYAFVACI